MLDPQTIRFARISWQLQFLRRLRIAAQSES
jgi:hypothetical protein